MKGEAEVYDFRKQSMEAERVATESSAVQKDGRRWREVNPNMNLCLVMKDLGLKENFADFVVKELEESFENKDNGKYVRCWEQYSCTLKQTNKPLAYGNEIILKHNFMLVLPSSMDRNIPRRKFKDSWNEASKQQQQQQEQQQHQKRPLTEGADRFVGKHPLVTEEKKFRIDSSPAFPTSTDTNPQTRLACN
ncbi:hypothetical protein V1477_004149 [Vespula maculifrons]|uniref:Uncharacterized protein n=1 Tax=Vespula maculifrons TaxID=7453 RepID=A0ABD2CQU1_VESMC